MSTRYDNSVSAHCSPVDSSLLYRQAYLGASCVVLTVRHCFVLLVPPSLPPRSKSSCVMLACTSPCCACRNPQRTKGWIQTVFVDKRFYSADAPIPRRSTDSAASSVTGGLTGAPASGGLAPSLSSSSSSSFRRSSSTKEVGGRCMAAPGDLCVTSKGVRVIVTHGALPAQQRGTAALSLSGISGSSLHGSRFTLEMHV